MRQEFSWFKIIILVVLSSSFIVGCGTDKADLEAKAGRVTVVYAHPPCPPDLLKIYNRIFEKFRETHPHINLRVLHVTRNYEAKILTMFAGGVAPDVIFMYPEALPAWVSRNALKKLEPFMENDPDFNLYDYCPSMIRTFTYKGHLYGLPKDASAILLYYNKDMFTREGVEFPNKSWTWDDFLEAAKKLTKRDADGRVIQYGTGFMDLFDFIRQNGGRILSEDGKTCLLDSPEAIEAIQFKSDLIHKYRVAPLPQETVDVGVRELFIMGRMAMHFEMYPAVSILRERCNFNWDIAHLPQGRAGRASSAVGSAFAITTQSKNPQQAWEWIKWLTGAEGMKDLASVELPAYIPLARSHYFLNPDTLPQNKQVAIEVMDYAYPPPQSTKFRKMLSIINRHLELVWYGQMSAEDAVRKLVPEVNKLLAEK